jgi:hypothetical protein
MTATNLYKSKNLYLFNLSTDDNNPILNFSWNWVTEFSKLYQEVLVFTTHMGNSKFKNSIKITELGGGTFANRLKAIIRLFRALAIIIKDREDAIVFHHMSVNSAVILGLPLRIAGIKQGLWYSHSSNNWKIKIASIFVNNIFTSSESAFPIKNRKTFFLGHGIRSQDYLQSPARSLETEHRVVSIGRVTPIKRLENILYSISEANISPKQVTFIGPTSPENGKYRSNLLKLAKELEIELEILDQVKSTEIPKILSKYGIYYTGTPKSTDKAAIEAAISGCYVLSDNPNTRELVGMQEFWNSISSNPINLKDQIEQIFNRTKEESIVDRQLIQNYSTQRNDLTVLINKIARILAD